MAFNPYGLSYGVGQMLGGVPDAYYQGQQQAVQQKAQETSQQVNDLKLADLQRKEQERVALESEMSKDMPSDLVPDDADSKEKMAAVYAWRANNLRNTGYGSLAEPLDKQSMALNQEVLAEHGKMAAKQLMFGDYASALDILKKDKILSPDATAKNDPNNDDNILVTTHGQTLSISRLDVAAMASGEKNIFQVASRAQTEAKKEEGRNERASNTLEFKLKKLGMDDQRIRDIAAAAERGKMSRLAAGINASSRKGSFESLYYNDMIDKGMDPETASNYVYAKRAELADFKRNNPDPDAMAFKATQDRIKIWGDWKDPKKRQDFYNKAKEEASNVAASRGAKPNPFKVNPPPAKGNAGSTDVDNLMNLLRK